MNYNYKKLSKKLEKYLKNHLSEKRFSHSVRVANMCQEIAELAGYDSDKAFFTGLCHDISKEVPKPKMIKLVEKSKYQITDYEKKHPTLLHGKAGAYFLEKKFKIKDEEILFSIAYHVSGISSFGTLGKIVFISDKNERGRAHSTDEFIESLYKMPVDEMFKFSVKTTYEYLKSKNFTIFEDTYKLLDDLQIEK